MRKFSLLLLSIMLVTLSFAQIKDPVDWTYSAKKINATTYELRLKAKIEDGWQLYSQNTPDGGPIPTTISFKKNTLATLSGPAKEVGKQEKRFEELFGVEVRQYSDKVEFVQLVKVKAGVKTTVSGTVEFMTCNDKECLPPKTEHFSIPLK